MNRLKQILFVVAIILPLELLSYGWVQMADFAGVARHRTTMITIGNKIYTGLGHYNGAGINILFDDWWEYDPSTNAWSQKADYMGGICYHASGFTIGNYGYVGTGRISPGGNTLVKDFYRYDPATNTWVQRTDFPGAAIRGGVAFTANGYGYVGTGQTTSGSTNTFYMYNPGNDTWIQVSSIPTGGRISAVAFSINNYGYVGTGYDSGVGWSTSDFYQYNPATDNWTQKANVTGGIDPTPIPRMEATGFSIDGKGYILTGDNISSGDNYNDMYEYDPASNTWDSIPRFPGTSRRYLSSTVLNGVAYCGLGTNGTNFKDFWQFDRTLALIEKNIEAVSMIAYPNPAVDQIQIQIDELKNIETEKLQIKVFDQFGRYVSSTSINYGKATIATNTWRNGSYFYTLSYDDQILKSNKFLVFK